MQIFLLISLHVTCCIDIDKFFQVFKHADMKKEKNDKTSYRAASILPSLSKLFKKNTIDCMITLIRHFFQVNVDSAKDVVLIIAC